MEIILNYIQPCIKACMVLRGLDQGRWCPACSLLPLLCYRRGVISHCIALRHYNLVTPSIHISAGWCCSIQSVLAQCFKINLFSLRHQICTTYFKVLASHYGYCFRLVYGLVGFVCCPQSGSSSQPRMVLILQCVPAGTLRAYFKGNGTNVRAPLPQPLTTPHHTTKPGHCLPPVSKQGDLRCACCSCFALLFEVVQCSVSSWRSLLLDRAFS